jgi:hypothetical protein
VHAAAVGRAGRALLLHGPSGAGKSTLAYLAHSAGFHVLGEDRVWVQRAPALRVWGWPGPARLLPEAAARLRVSTIAGGAAGGGRQKVLVALHGASAAARWSDDVVVCVLAPARDRREVMLERLSPAGVRAALVRKPAAGFDRFPRRHRSVAWALAARGGWRLSLAHDPHAALAALHRMLDDGENDRS